MSRRAALAVALVLAVAACDRQPIAPQIQPKDVEPSFAVDPGNGPPPNRRFGPDTRETGGPYTGQGVEQVRLVCSGSDLSGRKCEGYLPSDVDGTLLEVTVDVPGDPTPGNPDDSANVPLVALLHGWGGSKRGDEDIAERLVGAGLAVLRYSARGFGKSFGRVNLADLGVEVAPPAIDPTACAPWPHRGDLQSMIGEVVDRVVDEQQRPVIKPTAVAVTGTSYGGGQSWLSAVRPRFNSPGGTCVQIQTIVPIVPWTDLLYSLLPNGYSRNSVDPLGALKFSYVNALYASGCGDGAVGTPTCDNYPTYLRLWHAWLNAVEPNPFDPVYRRLRDGVAGYRSIWWQQSFWDNVASVQLPVFQVQGLTDDLFTLEEAKRMLLALETVAPDYPIESYFGDIGHPRARNKPDEVNYVLDLIEKWLKFYLKGEGGAPIFEIHAAVTGSAEDLTFSSSDVITVKRYSELATRQVRERYDSPAPPLANPASGAVSGPASDPVLEVGLIELAGELKPLPGLPPLPNIPDPTAVTLTMSARQLGGAPVLVAGQPSIRLVGRTTAPRVQFNVRVYDIAPGGLTKQLVTRGTLTAQGRSLAPMGAIDVLVPTAGNLWCVLPDHTLQFEITNVDAPYLAPSRVPSATTLSTVEITVPVRDPAGTRCTTG